MCLLSSSSMNADFTSAGWSYLNADGYAATGWFEIGDQWYFSDENGSLLTNTVTPDGYRVDGSGAWVH